MMALMLCMLWCHASLPSDCMPTRAQVQPLFQQGIKGGLEELVDNSISALLQPANHKRLQQSAGGWTPQIWIEFEDNEDDAKAAFVIQDNGVRFLAA